MPKHLKTHVFSRLNSAISYFFATFRRFRSSHTGLRCFVSDGDRLAGKFAAADIKKCPKLLRMCNFCSTFVPDL